MGMIYLLKTEITFAQTRQIVIVNHDYNVYLSNQVSKKIARIEQSNKSKTYICVCTDITIE